MTSYTRKLYARDPAAANAFYKDQAFEHRHSYGRTPTLVQFTPAHHQLAVTFGKRQSPPSAQHACETRCGHPACSQGCVLFNQM